MGCCENKFISTDFVLFHDKQEEMQKSSFDSISIYSESESQNLLENSKNLHSSFTNTVNSFEKAFLAAHFKSRTQIIELHCVDED
jgi:hypothetical protein